jgi:hypothetical protein
MFSLNEYLKINNSYSDPILHFLTSRGHYSEVNNLLNAMIFALISRRKLVIDQSRFSRGTISWNDFYSSILPASSEVDPNSIAEQWKISDMKSTGLRKLRKFMWALEDASEPITTELGTYSSTLPLKRHLANLFCEPAFPLQESLELGDEYAAFHVRRGDKIQTFQNRLGEPVVEGEYIDASSYLTRLREVNSSLQTIFVMTDDYSIVNELSELDPTIRIKTLCPPSQNGYFQHIHTRLPREKKVAEVQQLILEAEIASQSKAFIGCYKSNVSRYIAMMHRDINSCSSVDSLLSWTSL